MARLRRRWRAVKWAGLVVSLMLLIAWLGPRPWELGVAFLKTDRTKSVTWKPNSNGSPPAIGWCVPEFYVVLADGSLQVAWAFQGPVSLRPGWSVFRLQDGIKTSWLPSLSRAGTTAPHTSLDLPVWILLLLACSPTAYLFYHDRRILPHCCRSCGYDLTGNTSGVCPECGVKI